MTGGVDKDSPAIWSGLRRGNSSAEPNCLRFGSVQVVDRKVKMDLLRSITLRPSWWLVVTNPYRRDPTSLGLDRDEVVTAEGDLAPKQLSPEGSEACGVAAVERYRSKSGKSHATKLPAVGELFARLLRDSD
jgi:hypothetical protein